MKLTILLGSFLLYIYMHIILSFSKTHAVSKTKKFENWASFFHLLSRPKGPKGQEF
jgi:hypothetical protein